MNAIVLDASALIAATTRTDGESVALRRRMAAADCHAPHLIDAELGSVLRRMSLRGQLAPELATTLLLASPRLVTHRHDHRGSLAAAAWALRDNLSFYDALYVALAAALDAPLITADARLASAPHLPCVTEVVG